jgi:hypothetical protein
VKEYELIRKNFSASGNFGEYHCVSHQSQGGQETRQLLGGGSSGGGHSAIS